MQDWRTNRYGGKFQVEVDENGKIIENVTWMPIKKNGQFIKKNTKPWEAMKRNGKIVKKTIEIPKNSYSKEEPEYEKGYKKEDRKDEIKSAKFVQKQTGKQVKLLTEKAENKLNPDAMVDGKYIEFKTPKIDSKNGIDSSIDKGLKQINYFEKEKAGFVLVNAGSYQQNKRNINKQALKRIIREKSKKGYVQIKKKKSLTVYVKK